MPSTPRVGVLFEVTQDMLDVGACVVPDLTASKLAEVYRAMRAAAPGTMPEPLVQPGRNPYAHGGR